MKRMLITLSIVTITLAAVVSAAHTSHSTEIKAVTVTGVIDRTNYSRYTSRTPFLLTHAEIAATNTASDRTPCATEASTYRLVGDDAKLVRLVGHKVRITGTAPATWPRFDLDNASTDAPKLAVSSVERVRE